MGRAKVNMELIKNEKTRTKSFKSRAKILTKKAHELKTLCDVDVCLIIHGSSIEGRPMIVWPPNRDTIRPLIESYKKQSSEDRKKRTIGVFDFLRERNKKVEGDLAKLRKSNDKSRFATWDDRYERCSEPELKEIANALEVKLREAMSRIEMIKGPDGAVAHDGSGSVHRGSVAGDRYSLEGLLVRTRNMQLEAPHNQAQRMNSQEMRLPMPYYNQHQQLANKNQLDHTNNFFVNPMFMNNMMMMGNNSYSQLGHDLSNNLYYNNYNPVYFNDALPTGMIENTGFNFSQPTPMAYYPPYNLQYPMMDGSSSSSQMSATHMGMCYDFSNVNMGDEKARRS